EDCRSQTAVLPDTANHCRKYVNIEYFTRRNSIQVTIQHNQISEITGHQLAESVFHPRRISRRDSEAAQRLIYGQACRWIPSLASGRTIRALAGDGCVDALQWSNRVVGRIRPQCNHNALIQLQTRVVRVRGSAAPVK